MKLRIKVTDNEFVEHEFDEKKGVSKDAVLVSKKKRRLYMTNDTTVRPNYAATYALFEEMYKKLGYIPSTHIVYEVIDAQVYVVPEIPVPKRGKHFIRGNDLKRWIAEQDAKYPKGWTPRPKGAVEEESISILEILESKEKITFEDLKKLVEVEDFE